MANHASSKKRIRRTNARTAINVARRSRLRTFLKKVEAEIFNKDSQSAKEALKAFQPELYRNVAKGILHKKTAARQLSRLSARVKAI